jgi:hypothetical protein
MISLVVPPVPVLVAELPFLTWYRGPLYLLESERTMLYAAPHAMLADA